MALYSPIGAWFRIALVALAHREMEVQGETPFVYVGVASPC